MRGRAALWQLPTQTTRLYGSRSSRSVQLPLQLLLFGLSAAYHADVGAISGAARVFVGVGGAAVGRASPADSSGDRIGPKTGRARQDCDAVAAMVARTVPLNLALANTMRTLHAPSANQRITCKLAGTLCWPGRNGPDAIAEVPVTLINTTLTHSMQP